MKFITYDTWQVDEKGCTEEVSQQFSSIEKVFLCEGEIIVKDRISEVVRFSSLSKAYYIKRYTASGRKKIGFFRKSRICSESNNLLSLKKMGIPVPNVIAHGEYKIKGQFVRGALITEAVENSANLAQHLNLNPELVDDKQWLYSVIDQLAEYIQLMHQNNFVHRDLNLRNVLVQTKEYPEIHLIDCPAGGFSRGCLLTRGKIRDLAHLDKVARYILGVRDLLRFYKKYKNIDKLTDEDKKFIAKIRHFHDKHRAKQNRKIDKPYRVI